MAPAILPFSAFYLLPTRLLCFSIFFFVFIYLRPFFNAVTFAALYRESLLAGYFFSNYWSINNAPF